ncbi:MAG: alpha/beta fold hydrolase [Thermoguttaceae bacterium]|jgi:pimeloyl-ACP methyl ester carboxylesterase
MKHLSVNGAGLTTVDRGSGLTLVLVHGFPLNHTMWNAQIAALASRYRVLAPDLRGFGASGVTEGKVSMDQMADDLAGLLDASGIQEPVVLCGLSMGGYIALRFWLRHRLRLRALILCDARSAADTPEAAGNRVTLADRVLREGPAPAAEAMLPKLVAETTAKAHPEVVEAIRQMVLSTDPRGLAAAARGMAERPEMTSLLPEITCPALLIVGQADVISTPSDMRCMAEAIPGAKFVEIRCAGHMSPMENPAEVNAAIGAFLAELE